MPRKGENIYKRKDGRWEGRYIKSHKPDRSPQFGYVYAASYSEVKSKLIDLKAKVIFLLCFGRYMLFVLDTPHAKGNTSDACLRDKSMGISPLPGSPPAP